MDKQQAGRPPTPITGEFLTSEPSLLQAVIISKKNNGGKPRSWQAVADEIGDEIGETFSGALMYRIAKGEIASDKVEQALGIKPKTARAPVCPDCNEVHVVGWCVKVAGEPVKPKPPYNRKRQQIRLAASVTKAERKALRDLANEHGLTWSEYCRRLAIERMEKVKHDNRNRRIRE